MSVVRSALHTSEMYPDFTIVFIGAPNLQKLFDI